MVLSPAIFDVPSLTLELSSDYFFNRVIDGVNFLNA